MSRGSSSSTSKSTEGIWQNLLNEVSSKNRGVDDSRNVILFGDRFSGRSTIVHKLQTMFNDGQQQHNDDIEKSRPGLALDYSYLDLRIDDSSLLEDTVARVNLWEVTQETSIVPSSSSSASPSSSDTTLQLLDIVLPYTGAALAKSVVLICLDISKPWDLDAKLKAWLDLLSKHIQRVRREDSQAFAAEQEALVKLRREAQQRYRQLLDKEKHTTATAASTSTVAGASDESSQDQLAHEIEENFGLSIVVVITKTDTIPSLQRNYDYSNDAFDFINQHLRRICLKYGAGLVYLSKSAKIEHWNDFWSYVQDELYRRPFSKFTAALHDSWQTEREELIFPAGADTLEAINQVFFHQSLTADPEEAYEVVMPIPSYLQDRIQTRDVPISVAVAETGTQFLQRHHQNLGLGAPAASASTPDSKLSSAPLTSIQRTPSSSAVAVQPLQNDHLEMMSFFDSVLSEAPSK